MFVFAKNINDSGLDGIINIKDMTVVRICTKEEAQKFLRLMNGGKKEGKKEGENDFDQ